MRYYDDDISGNLKINILIQNMIGSNFQMEITYLINEYFIKEFYKTFKKFTMKEDN